MKRFIALSIAALSIQGCSFFTRPLDKPVIEERLNASWGSAASVGTLSLTPERRVVLVNFRNNRFCAEAPTEVGIDVAALNKLKAELSQANKATAGIESLTASVNQNAVLNRRTQGMQLFLANSYFTCQMYMNGGIDERQLLEMQFQTLKIVEPLISAELPYLYKEAPEKVTTTTTQAQMGQSVRDAAKQAADAVLSEKSAKPEESPKPPSDK